ncbi:hypothetical protein RSK20926_13084 [Roseobacter sp. SK209-2-6]|nr:hypothetical protein RSK20926_13084 [Roseobacter sp. SK209-2-6]
MGIQRNCEHIDENGLEATTAEGAHAIINAGEFHADRCAGTKVCTNILDAKGARGRALRRWA